MNLRYSPHFTRSYAVAPARIQQAFDKQARLLLENPRHPSLRLKKYNEALGCGLSVLISSSTAMPVQSAPSASSVVSRASR